MPITINHSLTATTPDNTSYEIRPSHWNDTHLVTFSISGSEISGAFDNGGGITFGLETNGSITAAAPAGAPSPVNFSAGATSNNLGSVVFSNSNGVSFGLNGSTITASHGGLTTAMASNRGSDFVQATAGFNGTNASGTIASNAISVSVAAQSVQPVAYSAANGLANFSTIVFANSNGVSFSTGTQGLYATVKTDYLTTAAQSDHSHGNPTLALTNLSGTTASASNGFTLSLSAGAGGAGDGVNILAAGTQTANTTGTVNFANSNGITFGMSNNSQITASHNGLTSQSNQAVSGANGSFTFQTISFANSNGVSWSTGTQGLYATVKTDYLTTAAQSDHSHGNPTLALTNLSGTTASASNGFTLSLSASQSNQAVSGSNGSFTFQTVTFGNLNGLSFYTSNGSVVGSHNALTTARASNDAIGLNTALTANGVAWTVNSSGLSLNVPAFLTTAANSTHSHGNPTLALTNLTGTTASASNGFTLSLSANAPGAAAENNYHNLLGANTSGNTTASGSTIGLSGVNITLSGTNDSQIVISAPPVSVLSASANITISTSGSTVLFSAGGGGFTNSYFNPQDAYVQVTGQQGQGTLHVQPCKAPNVSFDRICFPVNFSGATNSTASITISQWFGIYTKNASTLSLSTSYSTTQAITHSGTANSSNNVGQRLLTMGATALITEGQYWVGIISRTTSGGANASFSQFLCSQLNTNFSGVWGEASNASLQYTRGLGVYSASTTAMPSSIAFSDLRGTNSLVLRQPAFYFLSGTV